MKLLAKRKVVFIIVEGPSDQDALGLLLSKIFDPNKVVMHVMYGDITSRNGVIPENIRECIAKEVKRYANQYRLKSSDFQEIIHIIDMDGTYISDDYVLEDEKLNKTIYSLDFIKTYDSQAIINRNLNKRKNVNKLHETPVIWGIPYSAYYMSCNLDHVLYNKLNSTDEEKENDSHQFARQYRSNIDEFKKYMTESNFSIIGEYLDTWKFIKKDKHSLERYTNLGVRLLKEKKQI